MKNLYRRISFSKFRGIFCIRVGIKRFKLLLPSLKLPSDSISNFSVRGKLWSGRNSNCLLPFSNFPRTAFHYFSSEGSLDPCDIGKAPKVAEKSCNCPGEKMERAVVFYAGAGTFLRGIQTSIFSFSKFFKIYFQNFQKWRGGIIGKTEFFLTKGNCPVRIQWKIWNFPPDPCRAAVLLSNIQLLPWKDPMEHLKFSTGSAEGSSLQHFDSTLFYLLLCLSCDANTMV